MKKISKTGWIILVAMIGIVSSCNKEQPEKIGAIKDRSKMAQLEATEITTIISDSGITKYRITTAKWDVFDRAPQPYWNFPKGIHFEKFNKELKVDADIHSNYARYNVNQQTWELKGKVRAMNLQGELFETEQLFWDQLQEKFYSDSVVKITQATMIINAIGFESNQSMTKYSMRKTYGPIILNEEN